MPSAGRASTSSPLARATSSMVPNASVWARATAVTTPMVGRAIAHRSRDVADAAGAHLDDGHLGLVVRLEQGQRHPELVVERAQAGCRAPGTGRGRRHQVLHRRLAHRPGHADHGDVASVDHHLVQAVTGVTAQRGQGPAGVVDHDGGVVVDLTLDQDRTGPGVAGVGHEVMAVPLAAEGHEQLPGTQAPAVHRGPVHPPVARAHDATTRGAGDLLQGQVHPPVVPWTA